jgi:hypothetical protein
VAQATEASAAQVAATTTAVAQAAQARADAALGSGGLGLTRAAWEAQHGSAEGHAIFGQFYEQQTFDVLFATPQDYAPSGERLWYLGHYYRSGSVPFPAARMESRRLIPQDSVLIDHYEDIDPTGDPTFIVDVYRSKALAPLFQTNARTTGSLADPWGGARPGTFHVIFQEYAGEGVPVFDIHLGLEANRP